MTRPSPVGETRGRKFYNIAEVVAYRKARMVSQADLAQRLHVSQPYVSMVETKAKSETIHERTIVEFLDAIDYLAAKREKMHAEGVADLATIYAKRRAAKQ